MIVRYYTCVYTNSLVTLGSIYKLIVYPYKRYLEEKMSTNIFVNLFINHVFESVGQSITN